MTQFRLLGLTEIWSAGRTVPAGQPRERLVLAALLVDAGRPVPPEILIERVWGDSPPDGARHLLHQHLTRVRRTLAELGDGVARLARRDTMYVLETDPELVDLHLFRGLIEQGRRATSAEEQVGLLGRALELWHGDPLADLSGPWVDRLREGLRRQRSEASTLWAHAHLDLGRPAEVVEALTKLSAEDPLSEPVVGVLMRALHATGRTAEALACYTVLRRRLAEDLGVEPGAELQEIHQAVLKGERPAVAEPAGTEENPATEPVPHIVPAQLPLAVRGFAGRVEELARLDELLAPEREPGTRAVICTLSGTAGVGKTALALQWAHRVAHRFPDGQLYVDLRGFDPTGSVMSVADALRGFLDALGVPPQRIPAELAAQAAMYRGLVADKHMLVVLDNARDAEHVRPLLPGSPSCPVVITSRTNLTSLVALEGANPLLLDVLSDGEARELLRHRLGGRMTAEPVAIDEIVARCARLPLALSVIAAQAAMRPKLSLAALAAELGEAGRRLDALSAGDATSDVRSVLSWSYSGLSPAAAELFRLLGLHAGPDFGVAVAASLAGQPERATARLLQELSQTHMLMEYLPWRFRFHDVLRVYAAERVEKTEPVDKRTAALRRMFDHYLHTAHAADKVLNPSRERVPLDPPADGVTWSGPADAESALAWFTTEHRALLAAVDQAAAAGFDGHAWQLAYGVSTYLHRQGHGEAYEATLLAAVAAATRLGDPAVRNRTHRNLGTAYIMRGRLEEAEAQLSLALAMAVESGDRVAQAHTHHAFAYFRHSAGRLAEALDHARRTLELFRGAGNQLWHANALNNVAWLASRLGHHDEAIASGEESLALHEESGDKYAQAAAWDTLGYAHHQLAHYERAAECYHRALALMPHVGDRRQEAEIHDRLGDVLRATGDPAGAAEEYRRALDLLQGLGLPEADQVQEKLDQIR